MDYQAFADRTKDKTFDELVHQGKRQAQRLLEDQGIAALALYISELPPTASTSKQSPTSSPTESQANCSPR